MGTEDIRSDWSEFLPAERIKEGITEIAFELIALRRACQQRSPREMQIRTHLH